MTISNLAVNKQMRLLVVEDEADVRDLLVLHLRREGLEVDTSEHGDDAIKKIAAGNYDLLVLDWMLPGTSGLEICRRLREKGSALPILMVTARADASDIVLGLETGANDYVTKPFEIPVLTARVRALLRRNRAPSQKEVFELGALKANRGTHEVFCNQVKVELTLNEFKMLMALLEDAGRVLTREQLITKVQGVGVSVIDRTVDTHVFGLRKKLGPCGDLIETIRGIGYRVRSPD